MCWLECSLQYQIEGAALGGRQVTGHGVYIMSFMWDFGAIAGTSRRWWPRSKRNSEYKKTHSLNCDLVIIVAIMT